MPGRSVPTLHLLCVQLHGALCKLETLLDHAGQLTDTAALHTCTQTCTQASAVDGNDLSGADGQSALRSTARSCHAAAAYPAHSASGWRG